MDMKLIAVCDENWAIGRNNGLLFRLPEDMKHFKKLTEGKTVLLGSNTLRSFPGGKPLKNRRNIVLSHSLAEGNGYEVMRGISELSGLISDEEVFVIGGASVYEQLLDYCDGAIITKVAAKAENPDRFFPNLDKLENWVLVRQSRPIRDNDLTITFCEYENLKPLKL